MSASMLHEIAFLHVMDLEIKQGCMRNTKENSLSYFEYKVADLIFNQPINLKKGSIRHACIILICLDLKRDEKKQFMILTFYGVE